MYVFFLVLHLLICLGLIGVVLIQSGKGGGLAGGAFGGSAQTVFGGRGATDFITRATMILGGAFFVTSLVLALLSSGGGRAPRSVIQREAGRQPATAPGTVPSQPAGGTRSPTTPSPSAPATPNPQASPPSGGAPQPPGGGGP